MSLIISNRATQKQLEALKKLGYTGTTNLSISEAADLIDQLIEEQQFYRDELTEEY